MTEPLTKTQISFIARKLALAAPAVAQAIRLFEEGATVPFIARYRKEATSGLDEVALAAILEQKTEREELEARRKTVLAEIERQNKLTAELRKKIEDCEDKARLEDLYLPYKPKRRTRATMAKERGLEPLAELILSQAPAGDPLTEAARFTNLELGVQDAAAALAGARDILAERISENAELRQRFREEYLARAKLRVRKHDDHRDESTKFDDYKEYEEEVAKIPSHRFLAIRRGEAEGVLRATLALDWEPLFPFALTKTPHDPRSPWAKELAKATRDGIERLLVSSVALEVSTALKLRADREAVEVFAENLRELLLAAPLGAKAVLGIDPGQRTGCKCAVVDATGKLLAHTTINLVKGEAALEQARRTLQKLCREHPVRAVAVGNGTHGRETEAFVRELLRADGLAEQTFPVMVNEAGASIYSASAVAREEFPDLDLTVRGAISIARRLQDPLAELVKLEPKSIGVGQYQHDVFQPLLVRKLDEVVERCVNAVGVELNTASAPLLARVAGVGQALAKRIVEHRDTHGPFARRQDLRAVKGLGPRAFEQAAGFLRVRQSQNPLDASAVHPERYELVERMARDLGVEVCKLVGNKELIARLDRRRYESKDAGSFTIDDIITELKKPGRDPRQSFEPPRFRDDVRTLADLSVGMQLEGVVTNVTAFGAFVDIGVHQDGLVHVSQLADSFVKTPADVVKVGDRISVRVLAVDLARKRISLSAKREEGGVEKRPARKGQRPPPSTFGNNPFATRLGRG